MSENEGEVLSYGVELWKQQDVFAFIKFEDCHLIVCSSHIALMIDSA